MGLLGLPWGDTRSLGYSPVLGLEGLYFRVYVLNCERDFRAQGLLFMMLVFELTA